MIKEKIQQIDEKLDKLVLLQERFVEYSKEYKHLLEQEIELLKQKKELLEKQI